VPRTPEQVTQRVRADHAAAAIEALHLAITALERAGYHLASAEVHSPVTVHVLVEATRCANKAHALMKMLAMRIP
jgi:hypothetical protein